MSIQPDYLFYVVPSPVDGVSPGGGGLCWLGPSNSSGQPDQEELHQQPVPKLFTAPPSHSVLNLVRDNYVPFLESSTLLKSPSKWFVVWNSHAGTRSAERWLRAVVLPILAFAGVVYEVHESWEPDWVHKVWEATSEPTLVVLGGDGTIADLVNQLSRDGCLPCCALVVVPLGTANALFASTHADRSNLTNWRDVLASLLAALTVPTTQTDGLPVPPPRTLPLASVRTLDSTQRVLETHIALVVASTALHAAILGTAHELRQQPDCSFPGVAVFKEAFRRNATRTWSASLELISLSSAVLVQRYSTLAKRLVDTPEKDNCIEGGFSYVTSCLVDRLESNFVIAPLRTTERASDSDLSTTMDLVVVRPLRDHSLAALEGAELEAALSKRLTEVMEGAYNDGAHIDLCAEPEVPIVEYYRCAGWRWKPSDPSSDHEICIDGKLIQIPPDGSVECVMMSNNHHDETRSKNRIRIY